MNWRAFEAEAPDLAFAVDIESAACIAYGSGEQVVSLWPANVNFTRPYE